MLRDISAVRALGEEVYVTTKYFNPSDAHGRRDAQDAFAASLDRLGLEHIDLYLVHWPVLVTWLVISDRSEAGFS